MDTPVISYTKSLFYSPKGTLTNINSVYVSEMTFFTKKVDFKGDNNIFDTAKKKAPSEEGAFCVFIELFD